MSKCVKCGNETFFMDNETDKTMALISCRECKTVVGIMENVDFKEMHSKVIKNHGFFERRINDLESQLKKLQNDNKMLLDMVETILIRVSK